jgi:hypothetical protein
MESSKFAFLLFIADYAMTEHLTALTGKVDGDPLSWLAPEVVNDKRLSEKVSFFK